MYRVELWRQSPPVLLVSFHVADEQSPPTWRPRPGMMLFGWPVGYEWRRTPMPGSTVTAATWAADWRQRLPEYDKPRGLLVAPPGECGSETAVWMD